MAAAVEDTVKNLLEKLKLTSKPESAPPTEPSEQELKVLRDSYAKEGQEHVFAFYDELSISEKRSLYERLSAINLEHLNKIIHKALNPVKSTDQGEEPKLEPLPESSTASILDSKGEDVEKWYSLGLGLVIEGQVAVVLMAGGQGTRLGSSAPKGCFDIGLPSHKSLFQIQAERIRKVQQLAEKKSGKKNIVIPWYVMTSGPTRGPTEKFFQEHDYFGLRKDDVVIFEQGVLPCISNEGKILLETKSKVYPMFPLHGFGSGLPYCTGCSCSRWEWRDIPGAINVWCAYRYAKTRNTTYSCLLRGQLPC